MISINEIWGHFDKILFQALGQTLYMSFASTGLGTLLGAVLGMALYVSASGGLYENRTVYRTLDFLVNTLRSFPFLVLIIVLIPLTKLLVGRSTGTTAAIVPLTIGVAPFVAKLIQNALSEVDHGVIEAAKSYGASRMQIIFRVVLSEALPSIIGAITLTLIVVVGFSAMAGIVGAGGLGDVAIKYGYQRFKTDIMIETVVVLVLLVQIIQLIGDFVQAKIKRGKDTLAYAYGVVFVLVIVFSSPDMIKFIKTIF